MSASFAQQNKPVVNKASTAPKSNQNSTVTTSELKRQALEAISQEVSRAKNYEYLRDRIVVWTSAADIIWENDPLEAKKLLRNAYYLTKDATAATSKDDRKFVVALKNDQLQRSLKTAILLVAQKREPKLVKELIDSINKLEDAEQLKESHDSPALLGSSSFAKRQLAAFAASLCKTDPQKAVEYAIQSLDFGVPQEFGEIFKCLLASNPVYARQLFSDATTRFLSDNSSNLYDGLILSSYLNLTRISESERDVAQRLLAGSFLREQRVWQGVQEGHLTDPAIPEVILATSQSLFRLYQIYYPERLGELEGFIRQVSIKFSKQPEFADEKISESKSQDDAESLLEQAEKEINGENKNALYLEAALAFAKKEDFTKALNTAFNATDETKRKAVENYIRRMQAENLVKKDDFYDAIKVIEKIQEPELRAETTIIFAKNARRKKEQQLSANVLIDTQKVLEKSFSSASDARAYLWLASAYTSFDPVLGFDLMGSAINRANQAKDLVELNSTPKIIHLGGKSNQAVIIGDSKEDFRAGFKALAKQNLTQTLLLAENFENKFLRGISVLASASAIIEQENKKEKTGKPKPQAKLKMIQ